MGSVQRFAKTAVECAFFANMACAAHANGAAVKKTGK